MAQHLPAEILFHIFTTFSSPDQYLNNLMLVCRDWYQATDYEMFWLATLKQLMKQQIIECNNENLENNITVSFQNYLSIKTNDIQKERKQYLSSVKNREKILVVDLKPFTKRKETNDDIYGHSYKKKCIEFIRERRKRIIALEMAKMAIDFEQDPVYEDKWIQIMKFIENNQFFDKKTIANLGIFNNSTTIFHIFAKQSQSYSIIGTHEFFDQVASFFLIDCGLSVSTYIEQLIGKFDTLLKKRNNSETLFEKFKNEVKATVKTGVPNYLLHSIICMADMKDETHRELVSQCIQLFKSKKSIKFKENMVAPFVRDYINRLYPNWENIELFLKDMNLMECEGFSHYQFVERLVKRIIDEDFIIELLQRAHTEFGLKLDVPLPTELAFVDGNIKVLKFLIEQGADITYSSPDFGSPLSLFIRGNGSNTETIWYMIEKGATIPPIENATPRNKLDKLFEYYSESDETKYLSTLKMLVDKFGPRFSQGAAVIEHIRYSDVMHLSADNIIELLRWLKQCTTLDNDEYTAKSLTNYYCEWDYCYGGCLEDLNKKETFRNFVENELGIPLVEEIIIDRKDE